MDIKRYLRSTLYRIEGHSQNLSNVVENYSNYSPGEIL